MHDYHFAALTALLGASFLAAGLATMLARGVVESWYRTGGRPDKVPPPPAYGIGWMVTHLLLGAAAWVVWLTAPHWSAPGIVSGLILYFLVLALEVVWSGSFFLADRPGAAFAIATALLLATLATLAVFWRVAALAGALMVPSLLWIGYVGWRNLGWWRHGHHLGKVEVEAAPPSTRLAA
jgi:tryptophan-rich sensory protein